MTLQVEQFGPYVVQEELGRGAMGAVYRATHELTHREVALKVLFPNLAATETGAERFRREVRVSAMVETDGVIEVFDAGEQDNTFYYAMELLEGREFGEVIEAGRVDEGLDYLLEVTKTLAACHEAGVVHRDLKPENIFVMPEGTEPRTKVLDFGVAAVREAPSATQTGYALGTPCYMSPEQAQDAKKASPASDVWSVGVLLYELVTGIKPFDGTTSTNVMMAVIDSEPHPIEPRVDVPDALIGVIKRSLAKEPSDRYANAGQLAEALDRVRRGGTAQTLERPSGEMLETAGGAETLSGSAAATGGTDGPPDEVADAGGGSTEQIRSGDPEADASGEREVGPAAGRATTVMALIASAVVLVVAGGAFMWRGEPESSPDPEPSPDPETVAVADEPDPSERGDSRVASRRRAVERARGGVATGLATAGVAMALRRAEASTRQRARARRAPADSKESKRAAEESSSAEPTEGAGQQRAAAEGTGAASTGDEGGRAATSEDQPSSEPSTAGEPPTESAESAEPAQKTAETDPPTTAEKPPTDESTSDDASTGTDETRPSVGGTELGSSPTETEAAPDAGSRPPESGGSNEPAAESEPDDEPSSPSTESDKPTPSEAESEDEEKPKQPDFHSF